jgi:hypothetical protein
MLPMLKLHTIYGFHELFHKYMKDLHVWEMLKLKHLHNKINLVKQY